MKCCKYKKYLKTLKNPEQKLYGFGNGLKTIKTSFIQFKEINLSGIKNFFFGINFSSIHLSNTTNDSNFFQILNSNYNPLQNHSIIPTFMSTEFDQVPSNILMNPYSVYYVNSGKITINLFQKNNLGGYGTNSEILHGSLILQKKLNLTNLSYISTFLSSKDYYSSNNGNLEYTYIPNQFPIPLLKNNYNPQTDTDILKTIFLFCYQSGSTSPSDEVLLQIKIHQNVEIITNQEPFYHTPNEFFDFIQFTEFLDENLKNFKIITSSRKIEKEKTCNSCKIVKKNMFNCKNTVYKLPNNKEIGETVLLTRTFKFNLQTNTSGNLCYIFNPYIMYNTNNTTINNHNIRLEWLANDNSFNWKNESVTLSNTTNLTSNSFFSSTYLNRGRLIKGEIKTTISDTLKNSSGKILFGISDYTLNFNGSSPIVYTSPQDDLKHGFFTIDNFIDKKHYYETDLANETSYNILPEYWNYYNYYYFEPINTNYPMGINTNCVFLGVYSAKPNTKIDVYLNMIYEVELLEYTQTKKTSYIKLPYNDIKNLNEFETEKMMHEICEKKDDKIYEKYINYKSTKNYKDRINEMKKFY